jgi:hypothetical protein
VAGYKFRLYAKDGDDLGVREFSEPNWKVGDTPRRARTAACTLVLYPLVCSIVRPDPGENSLDLIAHMA